MKQVEIGRVVLKYNEEGKVVETHFEPTMRIQADQTLLNQLETIKADKDDKIVKANADLVFANWFNKMNEIELADREKYEVASEITECKKDTKGLVRVCSIRYIFKEIKSEE